MFRGLRRQMQKRQIFLISQFSHHSGHARIPCARHVDQRWQCIGAETSQRTLDCCFAVFLLLVAFIVGFQQPAAQRFSLIGRLMWPQNKPSQPTKQRTDRDDRTKASFFVHPALIVNKNGCLIKLCASMVSALEPAPAFGLRLSFWRFVLPLDPATEQSMNNRAKAAEKTAALQDAGARALRPRTCASFSTPPVLLALCTPA